MKLQKSIWGLTVVAAAFFAVANADAKPGWGENFETAKTEAAKAQKHVLLDFTGSDWCGWCKKLDKEVFATPAFQELAKDKLILVELDFPQGKELPAAVKAQNKKLEGEYKVSGFPTIVLLGPDGKEVKRWSGFSAQLTEEIRKAISAAPAK